MTLKLLFAAAAVAAFTAGAASAQDVNSNAPQAQDPNAAASTATPATTGQATPTAADITGPIESSPNQGDSAQWQAGQANVVSNAPVPDTPANRKAYGGPMSHAGRHTAAAGN